VIPAEQVEHRLAPVLLVNSRENGSMMAEQVSVNVNYCEHHHELDLNHIQFGSVRLQFVDAQTEEKRFVNLNCVRDAVTLLNEFLNDHEKNRAAYLAGNLGS
jgi:hypothetical protein